jgi:protein-L-isoaspartate(D-aspartate) O-methyltransferase
MMSTTDEARERMVKEQIAGRGISDPRVLAALGKVPRERFVDAAVRDKAYDDRPLPIGFGQTISQPYIVARMAMLARLAGEERVLEIGAGCGYQTAVLAELCREVWAIEIIDKLAAEAARRLRDLGYDRAHVECFDGTHGWPEHAPYDAIIVAAGAPRVPVMLLAQLGPGGRLVIPVGPRENQRLVVVSRQRSAATGLGQGEGEYETTYDIPVRFVDLTGRYGWGGSGAPSA